MCGVIPEQGEGGAAVGAQRVDQGLENGDSQIIVSWKVVSVNYDSNIYSVLVETCENTCYKTALSSFDLYQCLGTIDLHTLFNKSDILYT